MAVASTSTPIPPSQWVKDRQNRIPLGMASISVRIEAPVVVKPEQDSKIQSMGEANVPENRKGRAPTRPVMIQIRPTAMKPSRVKNCRLARRADRPKPQAAMMAMVSRKGMGSSPYSRATARGRTSAAASTSRTRPTSLSTSLMFIALRLPPGR